MKTNSMQKQPLKPHKSVFDSPDFIAIRDKARQYQREYDAANRPPPPTPEQIAEAEENRRLAQVRYERWLAQVEARRIQELRQFREEFRSGLWTIDRDEDSYASPVEAGRDGGEAQSVDEEGQDYD
jgi:hypothetical protein